MASVLLAVLLDPQGRFDSDVALHLWARRYAFLVILQCVCSTITPWVFAACPSSPLDPATLFFILTLTTATSYLVSQLVLCYVTVLRVRLVALASTSTRVGRLFTALLSLLPFTLVVWALVLVLDVLPLAMLHVFLLAFLILYICFQAAALASFATAAREATKEAQLRGDDCSCDARSYG